MNEAPAIREPAAGIRNAVAPDAGPVAFFSSEVFTNEAFGAHHPLSIPRHAGVVRMCRILGWLRHSDVEDCPPASAARLSEFHDPEYIAALRHAVDTGRADIAVRERYNIGTMENPLFEGLFERAASTVGGSIAAAQFALQGGVAFHPAGGTHHGRPGRAAGFCYFNDPVFAIRRLLDAPLARVAYVDLDAHHGDGVQDAFAGDSRVVTISIHEQDRWPYSGAVSDRGGGNARNMPVPPGFSDSELGYLMANAVLPMLAEFNPEALVVTVGADGLQGDPLSKMALSNVALWDAVESLVGLCSRAVVLGGGGYNPWTVVRCWAGLWGRLSGREIPGRLPPPVLELLSGLESDLLDEDEIDPAWLNTLDDEPAPGPVRDEVRQVATQVISGANHE